MRQAERICVRHVERAASNVDISIRLLWHGYGQTRIIANGLHATAIKFYAQITVIVATGVNLQIIISGNHQNAAAHIHARLRHEAFAHIELVAQRRAFADDYRSNKVFYHQSVRRARFQVLRDGKLCR